MAQSKKQLNEQLPLPFFAPIVRTETLFQVREVVIKYRTLAKVKERVRSPEGMASIFRKLVANNVQEHVCLFCLDGSHSLINCSRLFSGTANSCILFPREIFQIALRTGAVAIVVAHNHPSGRLEESLSDRATTRRLKEVGELVGIPLLDHLIVTDDECSSAAEKGWL